jgi:glycosyltransferase involved in cell wall biosynthesis
MLCGVPVVVYDTGDTATVVRDGETGVLVRDGDIDALASALERLLADASARTRLANAARALARATFTSWDDRIGMEMRIVDGLVRRSR